MLNEMMKTRLEIETRDNGNTTMKNVSVYDALKMPHIDINSYPILSNLMAKHGERLFSQLANEIYYGGYVKRQQELVDRQAKLDGYSMPTSLDYKKLTGLKTEAVEKLAKFRPETLGQASRISGISPGDIAVLMVHLRRKI